MKRWHLRSERSGFVVGELNGAFVWAKLVLAGEVTELARRYPR